jgi:hypothetical protein
MMRPSRSSRSRHQGRGTGRSTSVFLKGARRDKINIVYYDVRQAEQVSSADRRQADQKMVELNGIACRRTSGFVKGHKYDVLATRHRRQGKVYAKATMT